LNTIPAVHKADKNIAADPVKIRPPGKGLKTPEISVVGKVATTVSLIYGPG